VDIGGRGGKEEAEASSLHLLGQRRGKARVVGLKRVRRKRDGLVGRRLTVYVRGEDETYIGLDRFFRARVA